MKPTSKLTIFVFTLLALTASAYPESPREQFQTAAAAKKAEKEKAGVKTAADKQAAIKAQAKQFEGKWYRIVSTTRVRNNEQIRQSFTIVRDQNGNWRVSGEMAGGGIYDVRMEGLEFKFKDENPNFGTNEYSGSLSHDGSRLRFTVRAMPPSTSQQKKMWAEFGPPNNRFGREEWLRE